MVATAMPMPYASSAHASEWCTVHKNKNRQQKTNSVPAQAQANAGAHRPAPRRDATGNRERPSTERVPDQLKAYTMPYVVVSGDPRRGVRLFLVEDSRADVQPLGLAGGKVHDPRTGGKHAAAAGAFMREWTYRDWTYRFNVYREHEEETGVAGLPVHLGVDLQRMASERFRVNSTEHVCVGHVYLADVTPALLWRAGASPQRAQQLAAAARQAPHDPSGTAIECSMAVLHAARCHALEVNDAILSQRDKHGGRLEVKALHMRTFDQLQEDIKADRLWESVRKMVTAERHPASVSRSSSNDDAAKPKWWTFREFFDATDLLYLRQEPLPCYDVPRDPIKIAIEQQHPHMHMHSTRSHCYQSDRYNSDQNWRRTESTCWRRQQTTVHDDDRDRDDMLSKKRSDKLRDPLRQTLRILRRLLRAPSSSTCSARIVERAMAARAAAETLAHKLALLSSMVAAATETANATVGRDQNAAALGWAIAIAAVQAELHALLPPRVRVRLAADDDDDDADADDTDADACSGVCKAVAVMRSARRALRRYIDGAHLCADGAAGAYDEDDDGPLAPTFLEAAEPVATTDLMSTFRRAILAELAEPGDAADATAATASPPPIPAIGWWKAVRGAEAVRGTTGLMQDPCTA